jgi:CRISPR/Cas system-associated endonuclease Cas3-HD
MKIFDFLKSKENVRKEKEQKITKEREALEDREKRWDSLSEKEKSRLIKLKVKNGNKRYKIVQEREEERLAREKIWKDNVLKLLHKHPREYYTLPRIFELLNVQGDEERTYYGLLFLWLIDNSASANEKICVRIEHGTEFFFYDP